MWISESDGVGENANYDGQIPEALRAAGTRGLGTPDEVCFRGQEALQARRPAARREESRARGLGLPLGERWDKRIRGGLVPAGEFGDVHGLPLVLAEVVELDGPEEAQRDRVGGEEPVIGFSSHFQPG
jgi:hypothetical protein